MPLKEEKSINEKVTKLFEFKLQLVSLDEEKQKLKESVISPEIKSQIQAYTDSLITPDMLQQLKDIDAEFEGKNASAKKNSELLDAAVRADTLKFKKTQWSKDMKHSCQFIKGKVKWNSDKLEGYAAEHPAILAFKTEEDPTTRIV
jgi:hypothetical protein